MTSSFRRETTLPLFALYIMALQSLFSIALAGETRGGNSRPLPGTANYGTAHPDAPVELRQFEFMVGQFTRKERRRNTDGSWGEWQPGEWNARYFMQGFGIIDESVNHETGATTANIRIFDPADGLWKVTWLKYPGYSSLSAEGKLIGEEIVIKPVGADQKYIFSDITGNSYRWRLEIPLDGQYIPVWEILCERIVPAHGSASR